MMARIQINDLPLLQDLTEEQLKELFGAGPKSFKPSFDALEERSLMSGFGSVLTAVQAPAFSAANFQTSAPVGINLNQPIQGIATAGTAALQTQVSPFAALLQDQALAVQQTSAYDTLQQAVTKDTIQQKDLALASSQPTQQFLDVPIPKFDQAQGQIAIANKAAQLGGYAALGAPLSDWGNPTGNSQPTPDGIGRFKVFQRGSIYWSPATAELDMNKGLNARIAGAHLIKAGTILDRYYSEGATQLGYPWNDTDLHLTPGGYVVFNDLYNPDTKSQSSIAAQVDYHANPLSAFAVSGVLRDKWIQLGGLYYGVPNGPQYDIAGGVAQDFRQLVSGQNATIFSSAQTGTHDVVGGILDEFNRLGGPGQIGTPTTDYTGPGQWNGLYHVVHFRKFDSNGPHDSALGSTSYRATIHPYLVYGNIYRAWRSFGGERDFGVPISAEKFVVSNGYGFRVSTFLSREGFVRSIYWTNEAPDRGSNFFVDWGTGKGAGPWDGNAAIGGPTGFEPVESTGTTSSPLSADPSPDFLSSALRLSTLATETAGLHSLDLSGLVQNSTQATVNLPSASSTASLLQSSATLQANSTAYASLFGQEVSAVGLDYIAVDPIYPLPGVSDQVSSAADLVSVSQTSDPGIGVLTEYIPGPQLPPVQAGVVRANPVADFTGVNFSLTSLDTGDVHQLQMQGQSNYLPAGSPDSQRLDGPSGAADRQRLPGVVAATVTFTALWDPASDGGTLATGTFSHDDAGNVHIQFNWGSLEAGTFHTFVGTLTGEAGSYHIDGTDYARSAGVSNPMAGDQTLAQATQVTNFTNVTFALTDGNGTAHVLQTQTQTAQPDGTVIFTAVWDGQNGGGEQVSGTLAYDNAGNVHVTFAGQSDSFDGTISGNAGAYHLDGNVMDSANAPFHVAGDQSVTA
jgi:hypothetical protein